MPTFEPCGSYIWVQADTMKKTLGGLEIPENQAYFPGTATVIAVGPGPNVRHGVELPMPCKKGDRILFQVYRENWHKPFDKEICMIQADQVIAVIKGEARDN